MRLIGLISGTSVDSIDAACVIIDGEPGTLSVCLHSYLSCPWDAGLRTAVLQACASSFPLQQTTVLNYLVGEAFAEAAVAAATAASWRLTDVDAIASHGQTIWHQPEPILIGGSPVRGTMQIGEPAVIAALTGCKVVADFRTADMAVGGQGAPIVPFADYVMFSDTRETRAVQNIGGIGNVTFLRAGGGIDDIIAFDTGPGNMLLDALAQRILGRACDDGGQLASSGEVSTSLLQDWMAQPFFAKPPPRTTGREEFGVEASDRLYAGGLERSLSQADIMATAAAITVESICEAYRAHLNPVSQVQTVIVGGGGVHNAALMAMLKRALAPANLKRHEDYGIDSDAKEAMAFALLAYETLHGRPSNVPSATGANRRAVLGKIALPPPES